MTFNLTLFYNIFVSLLFIVNCSFTYMGEQRAQKILELKTQIIQLRVEQAFLQQAEAAKALEMQQQALSYSYLAGCSLFLGVVVLIAVYLYFRPKNDPDALLDVVLAGGGDILRPSSVDTVLQLKQAQLEAQIKWFDVYTSKLIATNTIPDSPPALPDSLLLSDQSLLALQTVIDSKLSSVSTNSVSSDTLLCIADIIKAVVF